MTHRFFSGLTLMALGLMALLQISGIYYFGLAFWPAVVLWIGLEIIWGSLFDHHGPSVFGAAIGLLVGGFGLTTILANLGLMGPISAGEMIRVGWPVLLVALGISLLFGRRSGCCHWEW